VKTRYSDDVAALMQTVLAAPGATEISAREAASRGSELPPLLEDYVSKVRHGSHRITDGDISRLRGNGYSEDDIFEITIAAALGIAVQGLETALRAMDAER
jgi:alkylhydroperoxidase family enzyme